MLMGTPNYMSPEQVVGQPADHRSDIFAVGLVLYELVTYRQAFSGETQQSILLKVLNESPFPLASLVPDLDPALPAIVARALEKSVDRRYPDLEAMRSDPDGPAGLLICPASEEQPVMAARADLVVDGPAGLVEVLTELADAIESRPGSSET